MKKHILLACLCICSTFIFGQTNLDHTDVLREFEQYHSGVVSRSGDNLAIAYCPPNNAPNNGIKMLNAESFASDKPIRFGFVLTTNKVSLLFVLRPEYGFRISATTTSGEPVEPTRQGAKFGRYFDQVTGFDKKLIDPARDKQHGLSPNWYFVSSSDPVPDLSNSLPAPDDLFEFKKPGTYKMKIEAACFLARQQYSDIRIDSTNYSVEKFPPVELTITVFPH